MNRTLEERCSSTRPGAGRIPRPARPLSSFPLFSIALGLAAVFAGALPMAGELLQYDRAAIAGGEFWRVLTGHWTHWNAEHLLWDVMVFVALGIACESSGRRGYLLCVAAGAPVISLAVWTLLPQMQYYRGLSGLDAALYMLAGVTFVKEETPGRPSGTFLLCMLLLAALGAKVGYEALYGKTIFVRDMGGSVPVPIAHLAGALVGTAVALLPICSFTSEAEAKEPDSHLPARRLACTIRDATSRDARRGSGGRPRACKKCRRIPGRYGAPAGT